MNQGRANRVSMGITPQVKIDTTISEITPVANQGGRPASHGPTKLEIYLFFAEKLLIRLA